MSKITRRSRVQVARIELIGLVVHEQPVAYSSTNCEDGELAKRRRGSSGCFETRCAESMRKGEDMSRAARTRRREWSVPIRATSIATLAHDGSRGDLLGAFRMVFWPRDED